MLVTERPISHVTEADSSFRRTVNKGTTVGRVEFRGSDHLGQIFHICRFDINNILISSLQNLKQEIGLTKGSIGYFEVPEVHAQIVGG